MILSQFLVTVDSTAELIEDCWINRLRICRLLNNELYRMCQNEIMIVDRLRVILERVRLLTNSFAVQVYLIRSETHSEALATKPLVATHFASKLADGTVAIVLTWARSSISAKSDLANLECGLSCERSAICSNDSRRFNKPVSADSSRGLEASV